MQPYLQDKRIGQARNQRVCPTCNILVLWKRHFLQKFGGYSKDTWQLILAVFTQFVAGIPTSTYIVGAYNAILTFSG
jgi:hypothetical protein